jgi:urocanate hydratase
LSISGLPAGATASFSPSPVIFKSGLNTGTSSLTIATTSGVADGTYSFVVTANDGNSPNNLTGTGTLTVGNGSVGSIQAPIILSISLVGGQTPNLVISGSAHQPYVIQATTDLANPSWTSITTNLTDATGLFAFADQGAMNLRSRFYRAALPH